MCTYYGYKFYHNILLKKLTANRAVVENLIVCDMMKIDRPNINDDTQANDLKNIFLRRFLLWIRSLKNLLDLPIILTMNNHTTSADSETVGQTGIVC